MVDPIRIPVPPPKLEQIKSTYSTPIKESPSVFLPPSKPSTLIPKSIPEIQLLMDSVLKDGSFVDRQKYSREVLNNRVYHQEPDTQLRWRPNDKNHRDALLSVINKDQDIVNLLRNKRIYFLGTVRGKCGCNRSRGIGYCKEEY